MDKKSKIKNNTIVLYLDSSIYSRDAILKCLYWYSEKFETDIKKTNENSFKIVLKPLPSFHTSHENLETWLLKLKQDFVDFNLRDIVTKETKNIRDLLIAKAFSSFDTEEPPPK